MLGKSATTSRPRPPAQMRKSSSMKAVGSSPPPPYTSSFVFPSQHRQGEECRNLGSPISASLQMNNRPDRTPFDGKSHDELSELLVKADETIKRRETDLNRTHSLCKSLFEDHTSLQSKHKALFSNLPSTPPRRRSCDSPLHSPSGSAFSPSSSHDRHHLSINTESLIHTPPISPRSSDQDIFYSPSPSRFQFPFKHRDRHVRKISVTPRDIALLSEQNIELLLKVEKLESESASQDLAGRKLLRKLEKEINALRSELDAVRERELMNTMMYQEKARREEKRERGKGQRMMKSKSGPLYFGDRECIDLGDGPVRDFAPPGPLTGLLHRSTDQVPATIHETLDDDAGSEPNTPASSSSFEEQQREFIAQVLTKMAELEETNARLEAQQAETAAQLTAIQKETDSLGKVYEGLEGFVGTGESFELVEDNSSLRPEENVGEAEGNTLNLNAYNSTIRFRSFIRTLEGLSSMPLDDPEDIGHFKSVPSDFETHRPRKTVLGLFEENPSAFEIPSNRDSLSANGINSPTPSTLSAIGLGLNTLDSFTSHDGLSNANETLSSELGLDTITTGFTWDGPSDHLRTSSLYNFSTLSRQPSSTPSPSPSPVDCDKTARLDILVAEKGGEDWEINPGLPKTPMKSDALQLTFEAPTPRPDDQQSPAQRRYRQMSQTVRARTARWVDGRFTDNVLSPSIYGSTNEKRTSLHDTKEEEEVGFRRLLDSETSTVGVPKTTNVNPSPPQPIPLRLATVLDSVVEKFVGRQAGGSGPADNSSNVTEDTARSRDGDNPVELFVVPNSPAKVKKAAGVGEVILEIWLWLQFAVIILVFLWAMAKRGPKSVLGDRRQSAVGVRGP
ncbi:hypothetical protein L218DRAFT_922844 [Marasmius fiardii PR-910]|nr:hypothetical protein L218DRAFT_922844 [Marasmius fiardii PR-910]